VDCVLKFLNQSCDFGKESKKESRDYQDFKDKCEADFKKLKDDLDEVKKDIKLLLSRH
jgi:hypothetical protein